MIVILKKEGNDVMTTGPGTGEKEGNHIIFLLFPNLLSSSVCPIMGSL